MANNAAADNRSLKSHHDRIDEKKRGGDAGIHETEAEIKRHGRRGEHHAQHGKQSQLLTAHEQRLAFHRHEQPEHNHGKRETIEQHRVGIDAILIQEQCAQRIGTVTHGRSYAARISLQS